MEKINMFQQVNHSKLSIWRRCILLMATALLIVSSFAAYAPSAHASGFPESDDTYSFSGIDGAKGGTNKMHVVRANGDNVPAIIFVHGGGWRVDGGTFGPDFQQRAAARGYTSFRLDYTLGPNGIYSQLDEIMDAIKYIHDNAAKYNIDANRIAIWGDSAGGSLVVRAASTGKSGAAVAVGWSAPTNAFRDMFNSLAGFLDGLDHSTCVDTSFTEILTDILPLFMDASGQFQAIMAGIQKGQLPPPDQVIKFANTTLAMANMAIDELPSTFDKLEKSANEWGITFTPAEQTAGSQTDTTNQTDSNTAPSSDGTSQSDNGTVTPPVSKEELKNTLRTMTPDERAQVGKAAIYLAKTSQNKDLTAEQKQMIGTMQLGMNDIMQAAASNQRYTTIAPYSPDKVSDDTFAAVAKKNSISVDALYSAAKQLKIAPKKLVYVLNNTDYSIDSFQVQMEKQGMTADQFADHVLQSAQPSDNTAGAESDVNITAPVNIQGDMLTKKIIECLQNFIDASPALFASPRTPPMFLASAQSEYLVNPADTRQMSEKLRSMGIRSEYMILPGDNHMGYDPRAEGPSFDFVSSILHPAP